jgi:hypothetical protein
VLGRGLVLTIDVPLTGEIDQVRIRSAWRDFTR